MTRLLLALALLLVTPANLLSEEQKPLVGVITALTGGMATIGTAVRNGIELARSEHPELFKGIEFAYEDSQYDARNSLSAFESINRKQPRVILGFGNILAYAIGPAVEREKLPFININFEATPAVGKPFIVRSTNYTDQYVETLAKYFISKNEFDFAIVQADSSFLQTMVGGFKQALGPTGKIEQIQIISPTETDFRTNIAKLRRFDGKRIGLFLWPEQITAFLRQAKALKLSATYFGTDLCESAATLPQNDGLVEGCLYPDNDASEKFRAAYRKMFGNESQLTFAASGYDMTILIGELLRNSPTLSHDQFIKALAEIRDRSGVLGRFSFRKLENLGSFFEYPIHVKQIVGSRGVAVN